MTVMLFMVKLYLLADCVAPGHLKRRVAAATALLKAWSHDTRVGFKMSCLNIHVLIHPGPVLGEGIPYSGIFNFANTVLVPGQDL